MGVRILIVCAMLALTQACDDTTDNDDEAGADSDADGDGDAEADGDADADEDSDPDPEPDADPEPDFEPEPYREPPPAGRMGEIEVLLEETPESPPPRVLINEILAVNDSIRSDEHGEFDDWVELYNAEDEVVDLTGWGLSDDDRDGPRWFLPPDLLLGPDEHLLIWLDGQPTQGPLHASFSLNGDGDELFLYAPDEGSSRHDVRVVDAIGFGDQDGDVVLGRFPNGAAFWARSIRATPGLRNPVDPGVSLDPSDTLFVEDRVLRFDIWMPEESEATLAASTYAELRAGIHPYVPASIAFEGVYFPLVAVKIKGGWGSVRTFDRKAGFRVNLDYFVPGLRFRGMENLTFNNMVQDRSCIHERLVYRVFRESGVPAPRLAHVELYLNGEYRGLYLLLETPDDQFLERWFDNPNGNLYEGAYGQDVNPSRLHQLHLDEEGSEGVDDRSDLIALSDFLANPMTEEHVPELEAILDVDNVLRTFAIEVVSAHWDGYYYSPNNYRLYLDPATGRFSIFPWGTDQTFVRTRPIYDARGRIGRWLIGVPSIRRRFDVELWRAADRFRDPALVDEARFIEDMITPSLEADPYREFGPETMHQQVDATITFLSTFPDQVVSELFPDGEPGYDGEPPLGGEE